MENYVLAVDIGTTSTKGLAVRSDGTVMSTFQKGYPTHHRNPGYAEQDPGEVFAAISDVIAETVRMSPGRPAALSFSSAMHSIMCVDKSGNPISPLIIWADCRSTPQAERIFHSPAGKTILYETGTPIHPMSPLCKLMWMKEEAPQLFASTHKFISIKEYVFLKFFDTYIVDFSIASASGLFDNQKLCWSASALGLLGLPDGKLSALASPYHACSGLKKEFAEKFRLDVLTPFVLGAGDGCLAHLGSDAMSPGDLSITIGTSGAVRMATTEFRHDDEGRIFNYRLDEHAFITGGATNNGAVLLTWFVENIDGKTHNSAAFVEEALTVPDSQGLVFLPYLQGERSPINDPLARGVFFGINIQHRNAHFKRAVLEGICFGLMSIVEVLEQVVHPVERIMASGGFVKSDKWVQLLADVLQKPVAVKSQSDASSLGAALIGYRALKTSVDFSASAGPGKIFRPDPAVRERYQKLFAFSAPLYRTLKNEFAQLHALAPY